jgi:hypothetical protein
MGTGVLVEATSGDITLGSASDATVRRVTATDGAVQITSGKMLTLAEIVSTTGAGNILISSADALAVDAAGRVRTTGAGTIGVHGGNDGTGLLTMTTGSEITSIGGAIALSSGTGMALQRVASTDGAIQATAGGTLALSNTVATGGAGTVALSSVGATTLDAAAVLRTTGTGALTLTAGTSGVILTMQTGAQITTASGPMSISAGGDMTLARATSTFGNITITGGKALTLTNMTSTSGNLSISTNDLLTVAVGAANLVRTTGAGTLSIAAGVDGTGDLLVTGDGPIQTATGALNLTSPGTMTLRGVSSTSGAITGAAKSLLANGLITTGGAGTVNLSTTDGLTIGATGHARTTGTGALTLAAGTDALGGSLTMAVGGQITTTSAPISLTDAGGMDLQTVSSGSALSVASTGSIVLRQLLFAPDALTIAPGTDGSGIFTMDAAAHIQTTTGDITIHSPEDFTIGRITSAGGDVTITSDKGLTLANIITTGLHVPTLTDGSVSITADDTLTILAAGQVKVTGGGSITLASGADGTGQFAMTSGLIQSNSGPITLTTPGAMTLGRVTSTSGSIGATATESITLQDNVTTGGAGGLNIGAGSGLTLADNILVRANGTGDLLLNAGTVGNLTMGTGAAIEGGTGTMTLTSPNHITLGRLSSTGGPIQATAGQTFQLNDNAVVTGGADGIDFISQKTMTVAAGVVIRTTGTGGITMAGGADGLGTDLTTGNGSSIESGGDVTLSASGRLSPRRIISAGGNITLTSGEDLVLPVLVSTTGAGVITATAGQHLKVRRLEAQTPITLTALTGAIDRLNQQDPLADGTNIFAPSVSLTAATGIGTGIDGPLQTAVDTLSALTTGTGDILISEFDAITLDSVVATDGSIVITAGGAITVANGTVSAAGAGHDVSLTSATGDVIIGRIEATNQVNVTAAGSILELGSDADPEVVALVANFTAGGGIGTALSPLRLSVGTLSANASGAIAITDTDDLLANGVSGAEVSITTLSGDLSVGTVSATGGMSVTAAGSILDANGDDLNLTAGADSFLTAGNVIGLLGDAIDVLVTNADLSVDASRYTSPAASPRTTPSPSSARRRATSSSRSSRNSVFP